MFRFNEMLNNFSSYAVNFFQSRHRFEMNQTKVLSIFHQIKFQKHISFFHFYFFQHKSWIWQTLGHVTKKFLYRHFHNASKQCFWPKIFLNFMHRFKSAILAKMKNCQNGTFEPVHEIQKFFWPKAFF